MEFFLNLSSGIFISILLLIFVDRDEIGKFGSLLEVSDLKHDPHNNILEGVVTVDLPIIDTVVLG